MLIPVGVGVTLLTVDVVVSRPVDIEALMDDVVVLAVMVITSADVEGIVLVVESLVAGVKMIGSAVDILVGDAEMSEVLVVCIIESVVVDVVSNAMVGKELGESEVDVVKTLASVGVNGSVIVVMVCKSEAVV